MAIILIIEDGTGITDANSYVTIASVDTYAINHGFEEWAGEEDLKAAAILRGMGYIESYTFKGRKVDKDQSLKFPRMEVKDEDGRLLDSDAIPGNLPRACCEAAYREIISPGTLQSDRAPGVKRRKVAYDIETEYFQGGSGGTTFIAIDHLLSGLIENNFSVPVTRT